MPDRIAAVPAQPRWIPVTAAAALLLIAVATLQPLLATHGTRTPGQIAHRDKPVAEPRLVAVAALPGQVSAPARTGVTLADSLFDHSEDMEFILDPVVLHRGRAQTASHLPSGVQGEQTVISF